MKIHATERKEPTGVLGTARQEGEARDRWEWVEAAVWTERMLKALEEGVKGGKWFSLMDKVCGKENLEAAFGKVKANRGGAGVDRVSIARFEEGLESRLERLSRELKEGLYRPSAVKRHWIPKGPGSGEERPLGIPTVKDRVVQTAMRNVLEPIFERDFAEGSYGFRPGRSCHDALGRVEAGLLGGKVWVVDADIRSYFDTIDHDRLMELVEGKVSDGGVLELLRAFLKQEVLDGCKRWEPGKGTPQGAVVSPLLANIYLDPLDRLMEERGREMIRYADDFVILCDSEAQAREALEEVGRWAREVGLQMHPEKTRIVDAGTPGGFDFLGYHFERGGKYWASKKSVRKLRANLREKLGRGRPGSVEKIVGEINPVLRGWFNYFATCSASEMSAVDKWVRMRIRSILRRRSKRKGRGRGLDHNRWPNAYFEGQGLYNLATAHAANIQAS